MTESQEHLSPYHYGYDNPLRFSDPNGRCPHCPEDNSLDAARLGMAVGASLVEVGRSLQTIAYNTTEGLGRMTGLDIARTDPGMKWQAVEVKTADGRYETQMKQVPREGFICDAAGHILDSVNVSASVSGSSGLLSAKENGSNN